MSRDLQQLVLDHDAIANYAMVDFALPVVDVRELSPRHFRIEGRGLYNSREVGLTAYINDVDPNTAFLKWLDNNQVGEQPPVKATFDGIVLESLGEPTANLLELLASLYGYPDLSFDVPREIKLTAITLDGVPANILSHEAKIKVFHHDFCGEDCGEDCEAPDYFEMYINPQLPKGVIEFREKDTDYRLGFLRAFGAKL